MNILDRLDQALADAPAEDDGGGVFIISTAHLRALLDAARAAQAECLDVTLAGPHLMPLPVRRLAAALAPLLEDTSD